MRTRNRAERRTKKHKFHGDMDRQKKLRSISITKGMK